MNQRKCVVALALAGVGCSSARAPEGSIPAAGQPARAFTVNVSVEGGGEGRVFGAGIDCAASCLLTVSEGEKLALIATASAGSHLVGWSLAACVGAMCEVAVDRDLSIAAIFERDTPPVVTQSKAGLCSTDGWCWENPTPQGNRVNRVWVRSPSDVWAAANGGTVMRFDGARWSRMPLDAGRDIDEDVNALWGLSPSDVWTVGEGGHVHHFDGTSWSRLDAGVDVTLFDVRGGPSGDVWIAGAAGTLLRYDSGSFTRMPKVGDMDINSVYPVAPGQVWLGLGHDWDPGEILIGDGSQWTLARLTFTAAVLWASESGEVWSAGRAGGAHAARWDGGSWTEFVSRDANGWVEAVGLFAGSEPGHPWMVTEGGLRRFDDGGWSAAVQPPWPLWTMTVAPHDDIWLGFGNGAVGRFGNDRLDTVYRDAFGASWSTAALAMWASAPDDVWIGYEAFLEPDGAFAHFDGHAWRKVSLPTLPTPRTPTVAGVWGSSGSDVWAVGWVYLPDKTAYQDATWHYDGASWTDVSAVTGSGFGHVTGTAPNDVWLYGSPGIRHWDGTAWTTMSQSSVLFVTPQGDGWTAYVTCPVYDPVTRNCAGYRGWISVAVGTPAPVFVSNWDIRAMWGVTSNDLWAVGGFTDGAGGVIAHHTAQGWTPVVELPWKLYDVRGSRADDIWAVGDHGLVLHFDGQSWSREHSGAGIALESVFPLAGGDVIIAGGYGAILRKTR